MSATEEKEGGGTSQDDNFDVDYHDYTSSNTKRSRKKRSSYVHPVLDHEKEVKSLSYSPNGKLIASSGMDGLVKIYNVQMKKVVKVEEIGFAVRSISFAPDGLCIAVGGAIAKGETAATVKVINVESKQATRHKSEAIQSWKGGCRRVVGSASRRVGGTLGR